MGAWKPGRGVASPGRSTASLRAVPREGMTRPGPAHAGAHAVTRRPQARPHCMSALDLYLRGAETAVASWAAYARGSRGAAVIRSRGVAAAVFPDGPARGVYNNALLERGLGPAALDGVGVPQGLLSDVDPSAFHLLIA